MNIDIRKNILENFKDAKLEDIKESIKEAVKDGDEIGLEGLGNLQNRRYMPWDRVTNENEILQTVNKCHKTPRIRDSSSS